MSCSDQRAPEDAALVDAQHRVLAREAARLEEERDEEQGGAGPRRDARDDVQVRERTGGMSEHHRDGGE